MHAVAQLSKPFLLTWDFKKKKKRKDGYIWTTEYELHRAIRLTERHHKRLSQTEPFSADSEQIIFNAVATARIQFDLEKQRVIGFLLGN